MPISEDPTLNLKRATKIKFDAFVSNLESHGVSLRLISRSNKNDIDLRMYQVSGAGISNITNLCAAIFTLEFKIFVESSDIVSENAHVEAFLVKIGRQKKG